MAASDIKSSPFSPAEIAGHAFSQGRRGFEPEEVSVYLRAVADHVARLEAEIARQRARGELMEHRSASAGEAAYARVARQLTEVVRAADEAADRMKAEAHARGDETLAEAREEAARIAGSATEEAELILADARQASEILLANARRESERLVRTATADAERARDLADQLTQLRSRASHPSVPAGSAGEDAGTDSEFAEPLDTVSDQLQELSASIWRAEGAPPPKETVQAWEAALAWEAAAPPETEGPREVAAPEPQPIEEAVASTEQAVLPDMNDQAETASSVHPPPSEPEGPGRKDDSVGEEELWGTNGHVPDGDDFFSMEDLKDLDLDLDTSFLDLFDEPEPDA
jgi:cell division septum initiation protein DivIVA